MPAHPPITRLSYGRTFTVAGAALGTIALLQIGAVTWRFFQSPAGAPLADAPAAKIDVSKLNLDGQPEEPIVAKDPLDNEPVVISEEGVRPVPIRAEPVVAVPLKTPGTTETPAVGTPAIATPFANGRPTPVAPEQLANKVAPRFTELIQTGMLLRTSGDTAGALKKFNEAAAIEPGNAQAVAELAYTFEKMSLPDKAAEQWRRVLALGENAGALYSAARAKLDMAMASAVRPAAPNPAAANVPEGRTLGLGVPIITPEPAGDAAKKFTLQLPIAARRGVPVNRADVKVLVLFYEQLNGKDLTNNSANVSYRWASPPADWAEDQMENLEVSYELPANTGRSERRDYYGYIARLYYKGELQTTHAEPAALNQKFPAPTTLSE
jgi:hypothetical protein